MSVVQRTSWYSMYVIKRVNTFPEIFLFSFMLDCRHSVIGCIHFFNSLHTLLITILHIDHVLFDEDKHFMQFI